MKKLEYSGVFFGIVGAMILASNTDLSGYGYIPFLISSLLLSYHAVRINCYGLLTMQGTYGIINYIGILRWL